MSESRKQFEEWALQTEHAFRNKNGLWFYPSHSERDMFTGWSARDSEVERLREALKDASLLIEAEFFDAAQEKIDEALSSQVKESGK